MPDSLSFNDGLLRTGKDKDFFHLPAMGHGLFMGIIINIQHISHNAGTDILYGINGMINHNFRSQGKTG